MKQQNKCEKVQQAGVYMLKNMAKISQSLFLTLYLKHDVIGMTDKLVTTFPSNQKIITNCHYIKQRVNQHMLKIRKGEGGPPPPPAVAKKPTPPPPTDKKPAHEQKESQAIVVTSPGSPRGRARGPSWGAPDGLGGMRNGAVTPIGPFGTPEAIQRMTEKPPPPTHMVEQKPDLARPLSAPTHRPVSSFGHPNQNPGREFTSVAQRALSPPPRTSAQFSGSLTDLPGPRVVERASASATPTVSPRESWGATGTIPGPQVAHRSSLSSTQSEDIVRTNSGPVIGETPPLVNSRIFCVVGRMLSNTSSNPTPNNPLSPFDSPRTSEVFSAGSDTGFDPDSSVGFFVFRRV
jgi:hypothetical protein